ncbi:MAG: hypothetical protein RLZ68_1121, partial [Pseudomonadota bacterium]
YFGTSSRKSTRNGCTNAASGSSYGGYLSI